METKENTVLAFTDATLIFLDSTKHFALEWPF